MFDHAALIICGIGLFFAGLYLLTSSLRKMSGRGFRHPGQGILWGVAAGTLTQSMTAVLFMLIGLVRTGALSIDAVYPLVAGANIGSSVLVLATAFNLDLAMMLLVGVSGVLMSREKASAARFAAIAFGIGVLFLGLHQIKSGAVPLLALEPVRALLSKTQDFPVAAFAFGLALRLVVHSSVAIVILAATLASAQALTLAQAVAVVAGVVAGSGLSLWMLSAGHRGRARQVVGLGMLGNLSGAGAMLILSWIPWGDSSVALSILAALGGRIEFQVAMALCLAYVPGLALVPARRHLVRLAARWWPQTAAEGESEPRFIRDDALSDPETAIDLAMMEQRDVMRFFSRFMERARVGRPAEDVEQVFDMRLQQLNDFIESLASCELPGDAYERVASLVGSQRRIEAAGATVRDLAAQVGSCGARLSSITELVVESTDTMLLTFESVLENSDEYDLQLLRAITGDRSAALQRIRESFLARESADLDNQSRLQLLTLTNLCERLFWLMRPMIDSPLCLGGWGGPATEAAQ